MTRPPVAERRQAGRSAPATLVVALAAVGVATILSLGVGSNMISPVDVVHGLLGQGTEATDVVRGVRLPRTALSILVGAALGMAGAVMQSVTRNPLADPGILGVNAGASAAVVSAISFFGLTQPGEYVWFALIGAGFASVAVYLLGSGRRSAATPVRMALGGTAVSAALGSYVTGVMLIDPEAYYHFRYWEVGSLTGRDLSIVGDVVWFLIGGLALGLLLARSLNALALGEDTGRALGANIGRIRLLSVVTVMLLCGAATAAAGPIGFVGLAVPHLARMLVGVDHRWSLPLSMVLGVLLLESADIVGRLVLWPSETGAGIVTAVVGAPFLILLVRRRKVGRL
ncbi:hypothetical protein VV02_24560 [Luteipulveratus mongoliensis]|uniref:Iron ABC transporter permease n=1 Tax=Luteipulveratus mongoliensis TaxID=571913 RepID=A0A0K1JRE6_9MICO|nr:hypothetical protein VV02_24560 [Luteipulveratus mongoliensis]